MVLGIDPHKKSHTVVALEAATGELVAELTVAADRRGHEQLIAWARRLTPERRFAIEDCRHVSGHLERALIAAGERCVRVPPKLMAQTRRSARRRGKSDAIDAACVARAALREPGLPEARLAGPPSARCVCSSTTAATWSANARASRAACAGTCTTSASALRCLPRLWAAPTGSLASRRSSPLSSSPCLAAAPSAPPASSARRLGPGASPARRASPCTPASRPCRSRAAGATATG